MSNAVIKQLIESDEEASREEEDASMELPTSVTIVEEDGTTSVVEDASVSSILTDVGPNSSIQFGHTQGGNVTYRVVGLDEPSTAFTTQSTAGGVQLLSPINGQYYVIGSPQDVLGRQRAIESRTLNRVSNKTIVRDEKKRATHNEVERRRRDKINGWINKLAKIVPTVSDESTSSKSGQVLSNASKGGILAKACEYITELRTTNIRLASSLREAEAAVEDLTLMRNEIAELRQENLELKQNLGISSSSQDEIIISGNVVTRSH